MVLEILQKTCQEVIHMLVTIDFNWFLLVHLEMKRLFAYQKRLIFQNIRFLSLNLFAPESCFKVSLYEVFKWLNVSITFIWSVRFARLWLLKFLRWELVLWARISKAQENSAIFIRMTRLAIMLYVHLAMKII